MVLKLIAENGFGLFAQLWIHAVLPVKKVETPAAGGRFPDDGGNASFDNRPAISNGQSAKLVFPLHRPQDLRHGPTSHYPHKLAQPTACCQLENSERRFVMHLAQKEPPTPSAGGSLFFQRFVYILGMKFPTPALALS